MKAKPLRARCANCNSTRLGPSWLGIATLWRKCRACGFETGFVLNTPEGLAMYGPKHATWTLDDVLEED